MSRHKIFSSFFVTILLVVLTALTGCTFNNQSTTYHADNTLKFQAGNATGGYILVPLLLKEDKTLADVSNNLLSSTGSCPFAKAQTQKGEMLNISLNNSDCHGRGAESIKESKLKFTEAYLNYLWSSNTSSSRPTKVSVFVSNPGNQSGAHVDLRISFSGKSDYCFRTADYHATLSQNGTWQEVPGSDEAACT